MFIREKFVTNSSSTSFVGFGLWLEHGDVIKLATSLLQDKDLDEIKELLWIKDDENPEDLKAYLKDPEEYINDSGEASEIIDSVLGVSVRTPDLYDGAYIHVGMPTIKIDFESGEVSMERSNEVLENGRKLQAALKKAGLPSELGVVKDCWYNG
jgi:hypothetical protein